VSEWQRAVATGGRRDDAEPAVVKAFKAGGASVKKISGKDVPDLLVGYLRETHLVEVKTNKAALRKGQAEFARTWLGSPVVVARTPAQARKWLAVWRERPTEGGGGPDQAIEDAESAEVERVRRVKGDEPS
jgi:Holliday junction resolvase